MTLKYDKLGKYIKQINIRNTDNNIDYLLGVSNNKHFIPSIANIHGTDLSKYKIINKGQFAYGPVTSRNGDKISIALLEETEAIVSTSYIVFEIIDENVILPEYLILWFKQPEFDRYARYMSHGSVREIFDWDQMCNINIPIPNIDKQKKIVEKYYLIENIIANKREKIEILKNIIQSILKEENNFELIPMTSLKDFEILSSGINKFEGKKTYLATADVNEFIESYETKITYKKRPSRANMQPIKNSIWIAKMKGSNKHLLFDEILGNLIDELILSTGFMGFGLTPNNLYLTNAIIESESFYLEKEKLSTGTTMQAINNQSIDKIEIKAFDKEVSERLNNQFKKIYTYILNQYLIIEKLEMINQLTVLNMGR